jgi:protein O-GlcNAc transferase
LSSFLAARRIEPSMAHLDGWIVRSKLDFFDWAGLGKEIQSIEARLHAGELAMRPFHAAGILESAPLLRQTAEVWSRETYPPNAALGPLAPRVRDKRIHLAFVSADFREHPAAFNMAGLFEHLDRSRFELTAVSLHHDPASPMRARLSNAFERFIDADTMSDLQAARLMRELRVDIAIDMMGPTRKERGGIFALRCAPIQVNHFGWTSGAPYFDYILGDPLSMPLAHAAHFSEKIAQLPHTWFATDNSRPIAPDPGTRSAQGLPETGFVFCSFNNNYKIRPRMFQAWMRILGAVPGSVLWLRKLNPEGMANLQREAAACGVAPERLVFASRAPRMEDHLARHRLADLFLDTLPFNAQTTASDALWAGLPVLTCLGQTAPGRVAASLLSALELPELIASDLNAYEALAIELARQPDRLRALRNKLETHRLNTPLFDTRAYARQFEIACQVMVQRLDAGLPPAHITAR